jgi:hypothetical protein
LEARVEAKFHMYCFVCADDLMKHHGPVRVVRMWHGMNVDPVLRCLDDPEGLNNGDLLVGVVHEFEWLTI